MVNGVGYELEAPMTTFYHLPTEGKQTTLHIHTLIREDAHRLFAFIQEPDRALFRALIKTNGVGPKLALATLSGMDASAFCQCVNEQDDARLTRLLGVDKKTAQRLIVEMPALMPTVQKKLPSDQEVHPELRTDSFEEYETMLKFAVMAVSLSALLIKRSAC